MNSSWDFFFLVAGLVIITFSVGRMIRGRMARREKASVERRDSVQDELAERDNKNVIDKRRYMEELERHLDNRINTLKVLIKEADERIEKLSKSGESGEGQAGTGQDSSLPKVPENGTR